VDCGVLLDGYCGDSAVTIAVGEVAAPVRHLMDVTRRALTMAIEEIGPGRAWSDVAALIQEYVEGEGLSVVREFVGHGIGQQMHEEPKVPNFVDRRQKKSDFRLAAGMTLAIEPMVTLGSPEVCYSGKERWAVCTRDGRRVRGI
jgi:methionyl aminopeptidase